MDSKEGYQSVIRDNTYYYYEWDELFPQLRTTEVERENEDGTTETISLYEDIFQFGMVQSIAKARFSMVLIYFSQEVITYSITMGWEEKIVTNHLE